MKTYNQLTEEQRKKAIQRAATLVLTDIIENGLRFNDELNGDNLQARIDKAFEKAEAMRTPWFAHEYVLDTCREDIESLANPIAKDALYSEGETIIALEALS